MNTIQQISDQLESFLKNNPDVERAVNIKLIKIVDRIGWKAVIKDHGYCDKLFIPNYEVLDLFHEFSLDIAIVSNIFRDTWGYPDGEIMHNESYYHILLLLVRYGIINEPFISNQAHALILFKIWNSMKSRYIPMCHKDTMSYAINVMLSEKHLIRKYTNPHDLLLYHFNPTLLEKYKDDIIKNDEGLKKLLSQSIRRIAQLFVQGEKTENEIGKKISSHGLLPLYLQARKSGCRIIEENDKFDDVDDKGFDRAPKREKIYKKVLYEIQYEKWKPQFSDQYILNLSKSTGVKEQVIDDIIKNVHTGNKNIVHEVLKNLIKKYGHNTILQEKNIDVFIKMSFDQKTNISEERYNDAIKRLLYYLMKKIFSKLNNIKYNRYKETQQRKIMKVILHGIIFNYQEAFECRKPKLTIKQQTNN